MAESPEQDAPLEPASTEVAFVTAKTQDAFREPPSPAWVKAEAELDAAIEQFEEALKTHIEAWEDEVEAQMWQPFQTAVRKAARLHERLARRLPTVGSEEGGIDRKALWQQVQSYRRTVARRILKPLRDHLAEQAWGGQVGTLLRQQIAFLEAEAQQLPHERVVPEKPDVLVAEADESFFRRLRKGTHRQRRHLRTWRTQWGNRLRRLAKRPQHTLPAIPQTVPVQHLGMYHVRVRLTEASLPPYEALERTLVQPVAVFEKACALWTQEVLACEQKLDVPTFHHLAKTNPLRPEAEDEKTSTVSDQQLHELQDFVTRFQEALQKLADLALSVDVAQDQLYKDLHAELARDLKYAGTFLLDLDDRPLPVGQEDAPYRIRSQDWAAWHEQTVAHHDLNLGILAIHDVLLAAQQRGLDRMHAQTLEPVWQAFKPIEVAIQKARAEVLEACNQAQDTQNAEALAHTLADIRERLLTYMQRTQQQVPSLVVSGDVLAMPCDQEWQVVQEAVAGLPDRLTLHVLPDTDDHVFGPKDEIVTIHPQALAQRALQPTLVDQLKAEAQVLRQQLVRVWSQTEAVQNIVQYNIGAAADELHQNVLPASEGVVDDVEEENPTSPVDAAHELAIDGLDRAVASLVEQAVGLEEPWLQLERALFKLIQTYRARLGTHVRTGVYNEWAWQDVKSQVRQRAQRYRLRASDWTGTRWEATKKVLRLGQRQAQVLIRKGQSAVGVAEVTDEARLQTLDVISDIAALHQRLPLVYRKLFSFEPLQEPSLLEGRSRDMVSVRKHFQRWQKREMAGALALAVPLGSGRTSFINAMAYTTLKQADVRVVDMNSRVMDEADCVQRFSAALGYEEASDATLDTLEEHILHGARSEPPIACIIPNLEHLLLRAPGGMALLKRVLIFISRTDMQIYWVTATGPFVWRYIEQTASGGTGLVTRRELAPVTAGVLEAIILNRHQRSGMPLWFETPPSLPTFTRQRLRRAKTDEDEQAILQDAFFERLYRLSGQNILLALCYWLRSCDFKTKAGTLSVKPLQPLDFAFLQSFGRDRAFALHAFILHNTLTLEEHQRIFRYTEQHSTFILESLLNLRLIERLKTGTASENQSDDERIRRGVRYRLRPILLHPVIEYLRSQNILH